MNIICLHGFQHSKMPRIPHVRTTIALSIMSSRRRKREEKRKSDAMGGRDITRCNRDAKMKMDMPKKQAKKLNVPDIKP